MNLQLILITEMIPSGKLPAFLNKNPVFVNKATKGDGLS